MKKTIAFVLVCLLAVTAVFANGTSEAPKKSYDKLILRYGEANGASDERTLATQHFADLVRERTNGRIDIQVYPGGQLGSTKDVIQSLQLGAIDMCNEPSSNLPAWGCSVKYAEIISLPFIFRDVDHAVKVMDSDFGTKLADDITNSGYGVVALDHFVAGARNFYTKKPITQLSDMKGLKIRVQASDIYVKTVEAFGASATPLDNAEVYSALQTGVIDAAENPVKGYLNNKFYEVAPYYCWTNYMIQPSTMFISTLTWNKLTAEDQAILKQAAKESTEWFQELTASKLAGQIEQLKTAGVTFTDVTDYDAWVKAVEPIYASYSAYSQQIESIRNTK